MQDEIQEYKGYAKIQLIVEDSGVGISPENIKKLFANFSKLDEH